MFSKGSQQNLAVNAFKEAFHLTKGKREGSYMVSSYLKDSEHELELPSEFSQDIKILREDGGVGKQVVAGCEERDQLVENHKSTCESK